MKINVLPTRIKQPAETLRFCGQIGEGIRFRRELFMKSPGTILGQHINSYSRVIHTALGGNKIKHFVPVLESRRETNRPATLHRLFARLFCPDTDGILDGAHKNLAVTDFARFRGFDDGIHRSVNSGVTQDHFDFDLG